MGREIRIVPVDWKHPKKQQYNRQTGKDEDTEEYHPVFDEHYSDAAKSWMDGYSLWLKGEHPRQSEPDCDYIHFWEYEGNPPDRDYYLPDWPENSVMGVCLYQTVSKGTPVSPVFETLDLLAEHLAEHGDFWDKLRGNPGWGIERAKAFCASGGAPSFIGSAETGLVEGKLFVPEKVEVSE